MKIKTNKFKIFVFLFFILFFILFNSASLFAENNELDDTFLDTDTNNYYSEEVKNFSQEGQGQLKQLAARFNADSVSNERLSYYLAPYFNSDYQAMINDLSLPEYKYFENNIPGDYILNMDILPGLNLEAEIDPDKNTFDLGLNSVLQLDYYFDDDLKISASMRRQQDLVNTALKNNYNQAVGPESSLGINIQPTRWLTFSADYMDRDLFTNNNEYESGYLTSVGLELADDIGQFAASYQRDRIYEEMETVTDLELAFPGYGSISASYKVYDPDIFEREQSHESTWDLGLNFDLNELSRFSLGYRYNISENSLNYDNQEHHTDGNIEARFEIGF